MTSNDTSSEPIKPNYADFMVIQGSDGSIYQIPLSELRKFKVQDDEAKHYCTERAQSLSCRIKCRD